MMKKTYFFSGSTRLFWLACLLVAGVLCLPTSQAFGVVANIDNFNDAQTGISTTTTGTFYDAISGLSTTNTIGGNRILELHQTYNEGGYESSAWVATNRWNFQNQPGATGWGAAEWNGTTSVGNYSLGADFSNLNWIHIDYLSSDNETDFYVIFYTNGSNYATATIQNVSGGLSDVYLYNPADFVITGGSFDWANINRIRVYFDQKYAIDTQFRQIEYDRGIPDIGCVSKRCTFNSDYSGLVQSLTMTSFPADVYCEFRVTNAGDGNDTVYIEDTIPLNVALASTTAAYVSPAGIGLSTASATGPNTTIVWTTSGDLKKSQSPLVFRYHMTVTEFEGLRTNTFRARGGSETEFSDTPCPAYFTYSVNRVPSLNEWGMILLALILAGSAVWLLRKRRTN